MPKTVLRIPPSKSDWEILSEINRKAKKLLAEAGGRIRMGAIVVEIRINDMEDRLPKGGKKDVL